VKCPEDPVRLLGQPLGMYHCPDCGCMKIAGVEHLCDPDDCLLEDCDCLPPGVHKSPNRLEWDKSDVDQVR
jgi:hypothetical protein